MHRICPLGSGYGRRGGHSCGPSRLPNQNSTYGGQNSNSRMSHLGYSTGVGSHSKPHEEVDEMDCLESIVPCSIDVNANQDVRMKDAAKRAPRS